MGQLSNLVKKHDLLGKTFDLIPTMLDLNFSSPQESELELEAMERGHKLGQLPATLIKGNSSPAIFAACHSSCHAAVVQ